MQRLSIETLASTPLTVHDIDYIEETLDLLIHDFFHDPSARRMVMQGNLIEKIERYRNIALRTLTQPGHTREAQQLDALLCDLLHQVKTYYLSLN